MSKQNKTKYKVSKKKDIAFGFTINPIEDNQEFYTGDGIFINSSASFIVKLQGRKIAKKFNSKSISSNDILVTFNTGLEE